MKVVRSRSLDKHDKRRFTELTPRIDVDAVREAEFLAAAFDMGFVRQSWRAAHQNRRRKRNGS